MVQILGVSLLALAASAVALSMEHHGVLHSRQEETGNYTQEQIDTYLALNKLSNDQFEAFYATLDEAQLKAVMDNLEQNITIPSVTGRSNWRCKHRELKATWNETQLAAWNATQPLIKKLRPDVAAEPGCQQQQTSADGKDNGLNSADTVLIV
ncbi:hypothetical protein O9K51_02087 [Purpureocillium lavendulum]|uniref:Uncharacterized protein n=1 Tax=Purpureocillium lavendulum TaxID=1247861 RepID=A0AB34G6U4_9HYPO|nr:hypothetical protein O9K51_02087 [Purpureocillium lavendulum]